MSSNQSREMFEILDGQSRKAVIRVIGVGGGGCNTVNQMALGGIDGVEFICANTDRDHLEKCLPTSQIQLGLELTRGLGAGSNPEVGRQAAEEDRDRIREMLEGTDLLFITAGMGGGTGTGAAPVIAEVAKELGILTVAVVTKPFAHENRKRLKVAMQGIDELRERVDSLVLIPNEKLSLVLGSKITVMNCFKAANDVLNNAVQGISELITRPGHINVDFADVKTVMSNRGMAMMGIGRASGEGRAQKAVEMALSSPLLDDIELSGARGLLVNVTCDESLEMEEWEFINQRVNDIASDEADAKCGMAFNPDSNGEIWVTVVATGLGNPRQVENTHASQAAPAMNNPKVAPFLRPAVEPMPAEQEPRHHYPQKQALRAAGGGGSSFPIGLDDNIINIPAFLRNQAD
ncbi:cell division protein FtsZ [Polycyclovorans algicola]|uniref:cell division protein FtsZ n=1 Tax=Polycyclovorans algicola TaxID=616992 RepID=UPI000AAA4550|nr:cell division protein FtsZ [Polycyclovorans algicola]